MSTGMLLLLYASIRGIINISMSLETKIYTPDIAPLALDAWGDGENGYNQLRSTAENEVSNIENHTVSNFALGCLLGRIAHDANSNATHLDKFLSTLSMEQQRMFREKHASILAGDAEPHDFVSFLYDNPGIVSAEIARRTHANVWNTRREIDNSVRTSLSLLGEDTAKNKFDPRYKIRQFSEDPDNLLVMIDRKRTVRTHFGGDVLTTLKNSLIVDTTDATIPSTLRRYLVDQKRHSVSNHENFRYDDARSEIASALEPHMKDREIDGKPTWATPLVTTYYSHVAE